MGRLGAKALTRGGGGPYHWEWAGAYRGKMVNAGAVLLVAMSFAGCEDAAKRPVQAHARRWSRSRQKGRRRRRHQRDRTHSATCRCGT